MPSVRALHPKPRNYVGDTLDDVISPNLENSNENSAEFQDLSYDNSENETNQNENSETDENGEIRENLGNKLVKNPQKRSKPRKNLNQYRHPKGNMASARAANVSQLGTFIFVSCHELDLFLGRL